MFTGLVDDVGTIERIAPIAAGREFRIRCRYDDLLEGESIAVNGACLTVRGRGPHWFTAAAVITMTCLAPFIRECSEILQVS